jgi:hypothetical protein
MCCVSISNASAVTSHRVKPSLAGGSRKKFHPTSASTHGPQNIIFASDLRIIISIGKYNMFQKGDPTTKWIPLGQDVGDSWSLSANVPVVNPNRSPVLWSAATRKWE